MKKTISLIILTTIAINAVVIPNAQQELLMAMLICGAVISLFHQNMIPKNILLMCMLSFCSTFFYITIGAIKGATAIAITQSIIIYILSPVLWILVIDLAWRLIGVELIVRVFSVLALLASISVGLYIFLYQTIGPQAVLFFGSNVNLHLNEGYSGVIMHVSGSLIFLGAAFMAQPDVVRSNVLRFIILICIALAATSSGRTLAIFSLIIGGFFLATSVPKEMLKRLVLAISLISIIGVSVNFGMDFLLGVNTIELFDSHFQKATGGDIERPAQIVALINGAKSTYFLGAGHGIGVDYIRNSEFSWRYEVVFLALIYKLGIIGTSIVLFPIVYALAVFIRRLLSNTLRHYDTFFGSALFACIIAGFTNPYPEAFSFQWMYLLPTYYFLTSKNVVKSPLPRTEKYGG